MINKHDSYVEMLYKKVKHRYDFMFRNLPLSGKKSDKGEIDLIGVKGDKIDVYEVKCSYRFYKARRQLHKIKKILNYGKTSTYFYCGSANSLMVI